MSTGIDATVVLGLAGKAAQVFGRPGTYLSFPLAPLTMERSRLQALANDPLSPDGQQGLAEFSLLVNEVPNGPLWQPGGDQRLWDVYADVLTAELAEETRTPEEEADYRRAYALLYEARPDGAMVASPTVTAYEQYRDAYISAAQEYNNRKGQAELATDNAVKEQWSRDEQVLAQRVADADVAWTAAGHRGEVEDARRVMRDFGSRSPVMVWAGYRRLFDPSLPEIFFRTTPDNSMYLPTPYLPSDVVNAGWNTITVTRDELTALAAAAPEDLRSRLSGGSGDGTVDRVSFDYSWVTVQRPWFSPEVFGSRAWRLPEPDRVFSDGGSPPQGQCTAYVSGLVLARNITVRRRATSASTGGLGFLAVTDRIHRTLAARPQPAAVVMARADERRALSRARADAHHAEITRAAEPPLRGLGSVARRAEGPAVAARRFGLRPTIATEAAPASERAPLVAQPFIKPAAFVLVPGIRAAPISVRPPEALPADTTTASDPDEIYVIAFVCRLLPKSPDPDPTLQW
jgi:hypothetical protein